jgi:hypothetical protein
LDARRQQRSFRIGRVREAFFDLPDDPMEIDLIA